MVAYNGLSFIVWYFQRVSILSHSYPICNNTLYTPENINIQGSFRKHKLTGIKAWVSHRIHWFELHVITHPSMWWRQGLNWANVEVQAFTSIYISLST